MRALDHVGHGPGPSVLLASDAGAALCARVQLLQVMDPFQDGPVVSEGSARNQLRRSLTGRAYHRERAAGAGGPLPTESFGGHNVNLVTSPQKLTGSVDFSRSLLRFFGAFLSLVNLPQGLYCASGDQLRMAGSH